MSTRTQWLGAWLACLMAVPGLAVAQGAGPHENEKQPNGAEQGAPQDQRNGNGAQLSTGAQEAMARLHALNQSRARYAEAAVERAAGKEHEEIRQFFEGQASAYRRADERLREFAQQHSVDLESEQLQQAAREDRERWRSEYRELRGMEHREAVERAVDTFSRRNQQAIEDLRTLRAEVEETQVQELIDEYIAALEQESERAQRLQEKIEERLQRQNGNGTSTWVRERPRPALG